MLARVRAETVALMRLGPAIEVVGKGVLNMTGKRQATGGTVTGRYTKGTEIGGERMMVVRTEGRGGDTLRWAGAVFNMQREDGQLPGTGQSG